MPVPGGSGPYQPGKFYVPTAPIDAAAAPAIGVDADSFLLAELTAALTADLLGSDLAALVESMQASLSIAGVDVFTINEAASATNATSATESVALAESAVAVLGTISQDITDIEPLVLAEIELLLADVAVLELGTLGEASDPPPQAPALALPELVGYHVPGPLGEYRVAVPVEDEETVLALTAGAWLAWYD